MSKAQSYQASVHLVDRFNRDEGFLFDYAFVHGLPVVGDEIQEDGKSYIVTERIWKNGKLSINVTDKPTSGIVKC